MTHRAKQIVDSIAGLVRARVEPKGVHVFTHRRESLSAEQDELPALSIDYGDDTPAPAQVISEFRSVLTVEVRAKVLAPSAAELHDQLFDLRGETHIAIMPDNGNLGLEFVISTLYAGADAPDISAAGAMLVAEQLSRWLVHYSMNLTDPN